MWRYQTDKRSVQELWQVDPQQELAAPDGVGMTSPHRTQSAWRSASAAFERSDIEPATAWSQSFGGGWTQPCHNRWDCSSLMSPGLCNRRHSASAPASCSSQPAQIGYTQPSLLGAQWQSPSNYHTACRRHTVSPQQPAQLHSKLTAALLFTAAPGTKFSSCDHGMRQGEQYPDLMQLQQLGLNASPQMSRSSPLVCSSAHGPQQCSEAAALAASMLPNHRRSRDTLSGEVLQRCSSRQLPDLNDPTPEDLAAVLKAAPAVLAMDSSSESQCCKSEDSSTPDLTPVEQPTKANARKKKANLERITVEYLQQHHYFDMPLAEAAKTLDVGLSVMKRHCRGLGLARWPYRTRSSLRAVIEKTERYLADTQHQDQGGLVAPGQKANVIEALESHMKASTGPGGADLHDSIKKYRQSIFKLNYKLKKTKQNHKARHRIAVPQNAAERVLADQKQEV